MSSLLSIFKISTNSFTGQEEGERVVLVLRRHPFVIMIRLAVSILLFVAPIAIGGFFSAFLISRGLIEVFLFLSSVWYAVLWQVAFYAITMYLLDVWIVTDKRIIDSTQKGFFDRTVSELRISRVQNISVKVVGPIETFLHFGDLEIQTAGSSDMFNFSQIPYPEKVKDEIMAIVSSQEVK
jgi:uncharacterized membrane protein YdbT with pleckstrin-like domain